METILFLKSIFVIILFNPVYSETSDFDNNECLLEGANNFYKAVVDGVAGIVKSSDPLKYDEIKGKMLCLNYRFSNFALTGLKNCTGIRSAIHAPGLVYEYTICCPKLVLNYNYEGKGMLGPVDIDEKGVAILTAENYMITFKGYFEEFVSEEDNETHFSMKNNHIKTNAKGKLLLEATSFNKDSKVKQALAYINSNWEIFKKYLECPIMTKLMALFNKRQNAYLKMTPISEVFPKCNNK